MAREWRLRIFTRHPSFIIIRSDHPPREHLRPRAPSRPPDSPSPRAQPSSSHDATDQHTPGQPTDGAAQIVFPAKSGAGGWRPTAANHIEHVSGSTTAGRPKQGECHA